MNVHNVLPKGLKCPLMHIAYWLQVLNSLLEHITPASQSLDLHFEAFDQGYIIICAFGAQCIPLAKYWTGTPANIRGSASQSLPSWEDLSDFPSGGERLTFHEPDFWAFFPLALCITRAAFGPQVFGRLPWTPPEEACWRFLSLLGMFGCVLPICAKSSSRAWDVAAKLPWVALPSPLKLF